MLRPLVVFVVFGLPVGCPSLREYLLIEYIYPAVRDHIHPFAQVCFFYWIGQYRACDRGWVAHIEDPMGCFCHIPSRCRELLAQLCRDLRNGFLYHIDNVLYFRFGDGERGADGDMVAFDTIDQAGSSGHEQYPFF